MVFGRVGSGLRYAGYVISSVSWMGLLISMALVAVMICVMVGCALAPSVRTGWFL